MIKLKRVIIKEELVALVGDFRPAIILNQFIYWTERMFDTDKYIEEEKERAIKHDLEVNMDKSNGWIYKTADQLNEELMIGMSIPTIRKYIKQLITAGYLSERKNPKYKWDKTMQYRVNMYQVQLDLGKLGYALEGYKLLPNIQIEDISDVPTKQPDKDDNKKDLPAPTDKPNENINYSDLNCNDNDIIPQYDDNNQDDYNELVLTILREKYPEFDTYNKFVQQTLKDNELRLLKEKSK